MPRREIENVLIAGGAGFIGSHLCDAYVAQGMRVVSFDNLRTGAANNLRALADNPRFGLIEADVAMPLPASLTDGPPRFDLVINAACPASPRHYQADPQHTMLTCVVGTHALLALAERHGARFVMCSTSEIYGDPLTHPQVESDWGNVNPTGPRACYDEGKRAAEALCFDFLRQNRVDVRVARIFNTYGARMKEDDGRIVSNVICQALRHEPITIYGDGRQTRSFCHVSDMVDGLMRLAAHPGPPASAVNLGNPNELTIGDLVERVLRMVPTRSSVVRLPLPADDPRRRRPDIGLAGALLGWRPQVDLQAGLAQTIAYFKMSMGKPASGPAMRGVAASLAG